MSKGTKNRRVAVIGGDGIGPEVCAEALKVVAAAGVELETTDFDLGAARYKRDGSVLPDEVLEELRGYDAILLGAVGPPVGDTSVPPGTLERGLLLRLRFALDLYVNLRPFTGVPGSIAEGADFVVIRENTEGTYAGEGGFLRKGTAAEVATQGSVNTRMGVERCVRFAFELANRRASRHLTLVHKTNVLTFAGDLWNRTVTEVAPEFPDVSWDYNHVDAACIYLVEQPGPLRRHRHRQPLRRHPDRPGRRGERRHRLRRLGQPEPGPHRAVVVRAGARRGPRHRREGDRQPSGCHPLRRAHARAPGRQRRGPAHPQGSVRAVPGHVGPHPPHKLSTTAVGDAIAERL